MASTFDHIADANQEFTYHDQQWTLRDRLKVALLNNIFNFKFSWKITLLVLAFWLSLSVPGFVIWSEVKSLRGEFEVSQTEVISSALEFIAELEESRHSTTDDTAYSTSSVSPLADIKQLVDDKLQESFIVFKKNIQTKWEQCTCPPGLPGEPGLQGAPGKDGEKGRAGSPGANGDRGEKGEPGIGLTGNTGTPGQKGDQGQKGSTGEKGSDGHTGAKGDKGYVGASGFAGPKGQKGEVGAMGPQGEQGYRGEKGDRGRFFGR